MPKKLAIITTHPIQYYAPVFQLLARQLELRVFYTWGEQSLHKYDRAFKQHIRWDIPLLEGYDYIFLKNTAKEPGTHHFKGIINPDLISAVKSYQPDAILIYGWGWFSHLKLIRFFNGKIPLYFRGDSTLLNKPKGIRGFTKRQFLRWVYQPIHKAFYVGKANKAYFLSSGLMERQLIFAPHAIDNDRFKADRSSEANLLRKRLDIDDHEILILYAGKLENIKNPLLLLTAFKELNLTGVHLLFVGNGHLESMLKSNALNHEKIHFLDFQNQSQMPVVYQSCDLFCLPSNNDSWGLAVNEAMACGKAVLVSDQVGCSADLVIPDKNGAVFKAGDLTDLKIKLAELCQSKSALKALGGLSKEIISGWTFEKQVQAIIEHI